MSSIFVNGVNKKGQGLTDFGYYTEERGNYRTVSEFEELVSEDKAYIVEVFQTDTFGFHIRLRSENRRICAETKGKIEKKGNGLNHSLYQTTEDPILPGKYEDPHQAMEAYAEYALEHGRTKGISIEGVDWTELLDE
jgi:hypothetical protein